MSPIQRVALVTGANRGLGLEVARQLCRAGLRVVLTSRDGLSGKAAADKLQSEGLSVAYFPVDVTKPETMRRVSEYLAANYGRLDVLVNNAGVLLEGSSRCPGSGALEIPLDAVRGTMEVNLYGALRLTQLLVPLMRRNRYGRIVNVSSRLSQLSQMQGGLTAYRLSKTALNALTCILAAELKDDNILVNAVSPGVVRTRMGGSGATRTPAEGAEGIVWAATLPDDGPTGGLFEDGQRLPW